MSRLRKCVLCGETINNGEACVPFKKRYAHETCFNASMKVLSDDKQKKLADKKRTTTRKKKPVDDVKVIDKPVTEEECAEKKSLYAYIRKLKDIPAEESVPARISKNIQDYITKFNFTYSSIEKALSYFYEIKQNNVPEDDGLMGIVPYIHDQAQKYYQQIEKLGQISIEDSSFYKKRVVKISPQKLKKPFVPLDISTIGEDSCE